MGCSSKGWGNLGAKADPDLQQIIVYQELGILPDDENRQVLGSSQYSRVLYHVEQQDKTLRIVAPKEEREKLFHAVHGGVLVDTFVMRKCMDSSVVTKSRLGNRYAVVFVDYLTKWPEVFPVREQTAPTIARLFVEEIVCRHGVPGELLSDRGAAFLSKLMLEVWGQRWSISPNS